METSSTQVKEPVIWPEITRENKPWTRWWWLGAAVDEKNITRELEDMKAAGIGGVEITSIYGVNGQEKRNVNYLSEKWLELLAHTCREAERLDMGVDLPLGSGWRCGGPHVVKGDSSQKFGLRVRKKYDKILYNISPVVGKEKVKRAGPGGGGRTIDIFDAEAVNHYMERLNRKIASTVPRGSIRCQFHDSWEYGADWSKRLLNRFRERRGYDLRDYLQVLDQNAASGDPGVAKRVRYDYRITLEEMLLENFAARWNKICHAEGMLTRNQAHGSPGNLLDIYALADIPETEIFSDRVSPLSNKFASSAAHVAGRRLCSSESFTWLSEHFQSDLGKVKRYADYLFLHGINHIFFHGTTYSPEDAAWPGWLFYASIQFNSRNPIWRDLPELNTYIARCQSFLQAGKPNNDILLYWPIADIFMSKTGNRGARIVTFYIDGDYWSGGIALKNTARDLWDQGYLFDYVSDRQLQALTVKHGLLQTGSTSYRAVVVPSCRYIPVETVKALADIAAKGTPVIYHADVPAWDVPGYSELKKRRAVLKMQIKQLTDASAFKASRDVAAPLRSSGVKPELLQVGTGLGCVRRRLDDGRMVYFVVNRGEKDFYGWVRLAVAAGSIAIMDPWTGQIGLAKLDAKKGILLQVGTKDSVILLTSDKMQDAAPWSYRLPVKSNKKKSVVLSGSWTLSFIDGGPVRPETMKVGRLKSITEFGIPDLQRFAGTIKYELTFKRPEKAAATWAIDLGVVAESARVFLNCSELGVCIKAPYRLMIPNNLLKDNNLLVVEVTTLAANRIRDLDRRKVNWKIFDDINFLNSKYEKFDASGWPIHPGGLLGPVCLIPTRIVE